MNGAIAFLGIEASSLFGQRSGVGYYTKYLCQALATLVRTEERYSKARVFLLSHRQQNEGIALPSSREGRFPIKTIWFQFCLPQQAERLKLDLVHFTNYIVPLRWQRPYLVTVHDLSLLRDQSWHPGSRRLMLGNLLERSARGADLIVCASASVKEDIVERLGVEPSRIRVTALAPARHFRPLSPSEVEAARRAHELPSEYILYVGNIEPRKNLGRLVAAWEQLYSTGRLRLPLVLVGRRAWLYQETLQIIQRSPYRHRIHLTGYVDEVDLPGLFCGARLFVYPSLFEGFGLPVLEAMACGVPVLASDIRPLREISRQAALLVNPADTENLADGLLRLAEDESLRASLRRRALEVVSAYSWENTARRTLDAYLEVLERRPGPGVRGKPPCGLPPAPLTELEWAILRTVFYSSLFDYPLTPEELCSALLESRQDEISILECYQSSRPLQRVIDFKHGYFFPRKREELVEERGRREERTRAILEANRVLLKFICLIPYTRLVAISGSAAHLNVDREGDVDLFMVARGKQVWSVALRTLLLTKLAGRRKTVCFNFVLSDERLEVHHDDLFAANQIIHLKPLIGETVYYRFVKSNPFVFGFYPNFAPGCDPRFALHLNPLLRALKRVFELLLALGVGQAQEKVFRALYSRYLHRKSSTWSSPQEVVLEKDYLKLHTHSHRSAVMQRFEAAIAQAVEQIGKQA